MRFPHTDIRVADSLLRMCRGAAARFCNLLHSPEKQNGQSDQTAVIHPGHFGISADVGVRTEVEQSFLFVSKRMQLKQKYFQFQTQAGLSRCQRTRRRGSFLTQTADLKLNHYWGGAGSLLRRPRTTNPAPLMTPSPVSPEVRGSQAFTCSSKLRQPVWHTRVVTRR